MTVENRMPTTSLDEKASNCVRSTLARISRKPPSEIRLDSSIVDDLGLDSLRFVDLTLALEEALEIDNLPLQDWYDSELQQAGSRFSVASLIAICVEAMRVRR